MVELDCPGNSSNFDVPRKPRMQSARGELIHYFPLLVPFQLLEVLAVPPPLHVYSNNPELLFGVTSLTFLAASARCLIASISSLVTVAFNECTLVISPYPARPKCCAAYFARNATDAPGSRPSIILSKYSKAFGANSRMRLPMSTVSASMAAVSISTFSLPIGEFRTFDTVCGVISNCSAISTFVLPRLTCCVMFSCNCHNFFMLYFRASLNRLSIQMFL